VAVQPAVPACSRIGAVVNPLMHIFRERELSFMLKHGEAKLLIVPRSSAASTTRRWPRAAASCRTCAHRRDRQWP